MKKDLLKLGVCDQLHFGCHFINRWCFNRLWNYFCVELFGQFLYYYPVFWIHYLRFNLYGIRYFEIVRMTFDFWRKLYAWLSIFEIEIDNSWPIYFHIHSYSLFRPGYACILSFQAWKFLEKSKNHVINLTFCWNLFQLFDLDFLIY